HHTSQICPICGHTSKANRRTQADFACTQCGHTMNADLNAAIDIQYRAAVN
ncbi:MAG: transposase, partial [Candidatus Methanofastidiosa archaeon]|nr:transposase [Candidatus Methanofastidiosa archaeon]